MKPAATGKRQCLSAVASLQESNSLPLQRTTLNCGRGGGCGALLPLLPPAGTRHDFSKIALASGWNLDVFMKNLTVLVMKSEHE